MRKDEVVYVTETNHPWVSEYTGVSLDEVKKRYEEAKRQGLVCTIPVRK